jgi:hypothetical protein
MGVAATFRLWLRDLGCIPLSGCSSLQNACVAGGAQSCSSLDMQRAVPKGDGIWLIHGWPSAIHPHPYYSRTRFRAALSGLLVCICFLQR